MMRVSVLAIVVVVAVLGATASFADPSPCAPCASACVECFEECKGKGNAEKECLLTCAMGHNLLPQCKTCVASLAQYIPVACKTCARKVLHCAVTNHYHPEMTRACIAPVIPTCKKCAPHKPSLLGTKGMCLNPTDAVKCNNQPATLHAVQDCGAKCMGNAECSTNCMMQQYHLTKGCASCFGTMSNCAAHKCFMSCLENPHSEACTRCGYKNCGEALGQCTGIPVNPPALEGSSGKCLDPDDAVKCNNQAATLHAVQDCGAECMGDVECSTNCMMQQYHLTKGCASCFGTMGNCAARKCFIFCLRNPHSEACTQCGYKNCGEALGQCTGIPVNPPAF